MDSLEASEYFTRKSCRVWIEIYGKDFDEIELDIGKRCDDTDGDCLCLLMGDIPCATKEGDVLKRQDINECEELKGENPRNIQYKSCRNINQGELLVVHLEVIVRQWH